MSRTFLIGFSALVMVSLAANACVKAQPPTDTGDPVSPTSVSSTNPTSPTTPASPTDPTSPSGSVSPTSLAYDPDMKVIFAADCVICHGGARVDGGYRMTTYAQVMRDVRAGSASSLLVTITQPGAQMYRYFSGSTQTRQAKAAQVRSWVVTYNAQETR